MTEIFVGVDGGGTRTTAVAARACGEVVAISRGAGINFNNIGMRAARDNLRACVDDVLAGLNGNGAEICVGLSALDAPADAATTRAFAGDAFDPALLDLQSDAYTALLGFTRGAPGMLVICGTGSMLLAVDKDGRQRVRGGWGHALGDPGSGYALALDGLRAAIDAWEGIGDAFTLAKAASEHFALRTPRELIARVYAENCTPDVIADFARPVLALCDEGDAIALDIVQKNMAHVAREAAALLREAPECARVALHGGVFRHHALARAMFSGTLESLSPGVAFFEPELPPELGALVHLYKKRALLSDALLENLLASYTAFCGKE